MELLSKRPQINKRSGIVYSCIIFVLVLVSLVPLFAPVVVGFMNSFSTSLGLWQNIYYIFRLFFGISLAIGISMLVIKKDVVSVLFPSFVGSLMLLFPCYDYISQFFSVLHSAKAMSMTIDYTLYIINIVQYLCLLLLCIFTFLYSAGYFRFSLIIILLSVVSFLGGVFLSVDKHITLLIPSFDIICFGYFIPLAVVPIFVVLSTTTQPKDSDKYKPRRMKK